MTRPLFLRSVPLVFLALSLLLASPAAGQDAPPTWRWLVVEHGVEVRYPGGWTVARLLEQSQNALVAPQASQRGVDTLQVLSADAGGVTSLRTLEEQLSARAKAAGARGEFERVRLGKREVLRVRGALQHGGQAMVRLAQVALIGDRLIEIRASFVPTPAREAEVLGILNSARYRKPLPLWANATLNPDWILRFPNTPAKGAAESWIYQGEGVELWAQATALAEPIAGRKDVYFRRLAEEVKGCRAFLEQAGAKLEPGETKLPASIHPQAIGLQFTGTFEGKPQVIYVLVKLTDRSLIRLIASAAPDDAQGLATARVFLHQLHQAVR